MTVQRQNKTLENCIFCFFVFVCFRRRTHNSVQRLGKIDQRRFASLELRVFLRPRLRDAREVLSPVFQVTA